MAVALCRVDDGFPHLVLRNLHAYVMERLLIRGGAV
jgi:hypothetical protein